MADTPFNVVPASLVTLNNLSDAALQLQIDQVVATLPPDKKGAFVVHGDAGGVNVTLVGRIGDHWQINAGASYRLIDQAFSGQASVMYSW